MITGILIGALIVCILWAVDEWLMLRSIKKDSKGEENSRR